MSDSAPTQPFTFFGLFWRVLLLGAFTMAIAGVGGYFGVKHLVENPEFTAPDLLTLTVEEALVKASDEGFPMLIEKHEPTDLIGAGRILSQRPLPDSMVKGGAVLRVTVAEKPQ
jgi:beta-lactam-binding protein with PASTA domain